jgi:hypothetical protein
VSGTPQPYSDLWSSVCASSDLATGPVSYPTPQSPLQATRGDVQCSSAQLSQINTQQCLCLALIHSLQIPPQGTLSMFNLSLFSNNHRTSHSSASPRLASPRLHPYCTSPSCCFGNYHPAPAPAPVEEHLWLATVLCLNNSSNLFTEPAHHCPESVGKKLCVSRLAVWNGVWSFSKYASGR